MVVGGFIFYLLSVIIDPIFIPTLQTSENFCLQWIEIRSGYQKQTECVEFSDKREELKYRHNLRMEQRRANKMIGLFIVASVVTFLLMMLNPSVFFGPGVTIGNYTGAIATAVFYGIILGFILPTVFQILLPPPIQWLPQELLEIHSARAEFVLKEIVEMPE
jgi:hypothetical protein